MAIKILFQGDSITDAGRSRDYDNLTGKGYPTLVASKLAFERPGCYECLNRGISGDRVVDLYARWRIDTINLKPDIISILIGINDVGHDLGGHCNGVEADRFETVYNMLLDYTQQQLPNTRIIIIEPFIIKCPAREANWEYFSREVPLRAAATKRVAEKHGATFIPMQAELEAAYALAPTENWLEDGVHPGFGGHEMIARKLFDVITGFEKN